MQQPQKLIPPPLRAGVRVLVRGLGLAAVMAVLLLPPSAVAFVQPSPRPVSSSSRVSSASRIILQQQPRAPRGGVPLLWSSLDEEPPQANAAASNTDTAAAETEAREAAARRLREELEREKMQAHAMDNLKQELAAGKKRNVLTAVGSVLAAVALFFYQHLHPVEAVTLLRQMQSESPAIQQVVGQNGRPTVVDFYAEWCENCKEMAPVLREVEGRYKDKINFVVVNGDTQQAADLVDRFRVDGIPHLALITRDGEVKTALIGKVPRTVIEADLEALLQNAALPYEGYDAFEEEDHFIRF